MSFCVLKGALPGASCPSGRMAASSFRRSWASDAATSGIDRSGIGYETRRVLPSIGVATRFEVDTKAISPTC